MSTPSPALLAAVDQELAERGAALDKLVKLTGSYLRDHDDRTKAIAEIQMGLRDAGMSVGPAVLLAVAAMRLHEAGERKLDNPGAS